MSESEVTKLVISASRRTDIPAFYLRWLMDRISRGNVEVPNPFNRNQVKKVDFSPHDVAWIVFWSRNYAAFLKETGFFEDYRLFFHFTINPSHPILEPDMISPKTAFSQLEEIVNKYGADSVVWRYDPVVFYQRQGKLETNHDIQTYRKFVRTVSLLGIQRCYISIANLYPKVRMRSKKISDFEFIDIEEKLRTEILQEMVDLASLYGVQIYSCSNNKLLDIMGMKKGRCIDGEILNRLGHEKVSVKEQPTRPDCGCSEAIDIGDYVGTVCKYKCLYCYARP